MFPNPKIKLPLVLLALCLSVACSRGLNPSPTMTAVSQSTPPPGQAPYSPAPRLTTPAPPTQSENSILIQNRALLPQAQDNIRGLANATHYSLKVDIDYESHTFHGSAQITYTNQEEVPLDSLNFRLYPNAHKSYGEGMLEVSAVSVDGFPVETALSVSNTVLMVELPAPLEIRQQALIEMEFQGRVAEGFGDPANPQGYGIYTFQQGVLSMSGWYPILAVYDQDGWNLDPVSALGDSVYSDVAFYDVWLTTESDLVVIATGSLISQEVSGNTAHWRFVSGPARDFYLIMSPNFKVTSQSVGRTQVNSYYLPDHAEAGKAALSVAASALDIYNRRFGLYPYIEMDVVEAPMQNALGVEYPGVFLVASVLYDNPAQDSFAIATSHETAHQWWYNVVGNNVFDAPWLDEALATFSSGLYYQEALGQAEYQGFKDYLEWRVDALRREGMDEQVTRSLAYFESLGEPGVYGTVVYTKGALFFMELREEIGDRAFFDALQDYYQQYQFQVAETSGLLDTFERVTGRQLDDFYQEWLFSAED